MSHNCGACGEHWSVCRCNGGPLSKPPAAPEPGGAKERAEACLKAGHGIRPGDYGCLVICLDCSRAAEDAARRSALLAAAQWHEEQVAKWTTGRPGASAQHRNRRIEINGESAAHFRQLAEGVSPKKGT